MLEFAGGGALLKINKNRNKNTNNAKSEVTFKQLIRDLQSGVRSRFFDARRLL
jgi:hypothetical protein